MRESAQYRQAENGFTLIELVIVISLVSLVVGVVVPASLGMYGRYKASLGAEKVLLFMSGVQREAFLSGHGIKVDSLEGTLVVNGNGYPIDGTFSSVDKTISFFDNGTSSGGIVTVYVEGYAYYVVVTAPFGSMNLADTPPDGLLQASAETPAVFAAKEKGPLTFDPPKEERGLLS